MSSIVGLLQTLRGIDDFGLWAISHDGPFSSPNYIPSLYFTDTLQSTVNPLWNEVRYRK